MKALTASVATVLLDVADERDARRRARAESERTFAELESAGAEVVRIALAREAEREREQAWKAEAAARKERHVQRLRDRFAGNGRPLTPREMKRLAALKPVDDDDDDDEINDKPDDEPAEPKKKKAKPMKSEITQEMREAAEALEQMSNGRVKASAVLGARERPHAAIRTSLPGIATPVRLDSLAAMHEAADEFERTDEARSSSSGLMRNEWVLGK